jgi:hypothetical protein
VSSGLAPNAQLVAVTNRHDALVAKRNLFEDIATAPRATVHEFVTDVLADADTSAFDHDPVNVTAPLESIGRFRESLATNVVLLKAEVQRRVDAADDAITRHASAAPGGQADIVAAGLRAVFGDDFLAVPEFTLSADAVTNLTGALGHSTGGALTKHLTDPKPAGSGRDFPEDDWLHGVARVRTRMHHFENVLLLCDALPGASAPTLTPLQLPHSAGQPWLALELPHGVEPPGDRLLYTSALGGGFNPAAAICGLLVDEWTETIPARTQTTGVAFHHDRPNAEPPQAWLLALPANVGDSWSWDDLVLAVHDALDSAKLRAIEPEHLDATPYSALLPATHSAWTYPEISISNNLLRNLNIYERLVGEPG